MEMSARNGVGTAGLAWGRRMGWMAFAKAHDSFIFVSSMKEGKKDL